MDSITVLIFVSIACSFIIMAGIMAAVFYFIIRTGVQRTKNVNAGWEDFARTYHQSFEKGGFMARPRVTGTYCKRSFVLDIQSVSRRSGRGGTHRSYYTRITTQIDSDMELVIGRRGILGNLFAGDESSETQRSFDDIYQFEGDLTPISTPDILASIQQNKLNSLKLNQGELSIYVAGFVHQPGLLRELYDLACDIAELVEEPGG